MKTRKNSLILLFVFFFTIVLYNNSTMDDKLSIGSPLFDSRFFEWREDNTSVADNCKTCHTVLSGNIPGNGSLTVFADSKVNTSLPYNVDVTITGFTEANNDDVTIGFIDAYEDNAFFLLGANDTHISNVGIDGSGDLTIQNETIQLTAPSSPGNYTLKVHAIYTNSNIGEYFYYINQTFDVEVVMPDDSDPPVINSVTMNGSSLTNSTKIGGIFLLEVEADDPNIVGVRYSLNGSSYEDLDQEGTTNVYNKTIDVSKLNNGSLTLLINARDSAGNQINKSFGLIVENFRLGPAADIVSYFADKLISISDGLVDELWEDYTEFYVFEFGTGGYIKTAQNGFYIFALIAYQSSINWISIEFNAIPGQDDHMKDGHDSWSFGPSTSKPGSLEYFGDGYFIGASGEPEADLRDDIFYETFENEDESLKFVEMIRPLDTNDVVGSDVVFNSTTIIDVQFASDISHVTDHVVYTWAITDLTPLGGTVTTPPDRPTSNPAELSDIVFVFSFTLVVFSVLIHGALRVVSRPIKHEKRIVYTDRLPNQPTLKDVIRQRKSGPESKED